MGVTKDQLEMLKKEIPYKWKPQSLKFGKATIVAYIDARDAQELLDECLGPENWQLDYYKLGDQLFARISVLVQREDGTSEWISKSDGGKESPSDPEKGLISDCVKRAAVCFGVGRFLYKKKVVELPVKDYKGKPKPATHDGRILWNNEQISEYIENGMKKPSNNPTGNKSNNSSKYKKPISEPKYNKNVYTEETIKRVGTLEHNGKKGKDCLNEHLQEYNKSKGTDYAKLADLDDNSLNDLMTYIDNLEPENI